MIIYIYNLLGPSYHRESYQKIIASLKYKVKMSLRSTPTQTYTEND